MIESEADARAFVSARCDAQAMEKFDRLVVMLREENARQNLVAARSLDEVWLRHIADSVQLLDHAGSEVSVWLDLGTGAGFPGIALAVARPDQRFHLVESRKRRVEWLASVKADLDLENCTIHGARLEHIESFNADCITARAFAPLPGLLDLSARFSTKETRWILPKGRSAAQEVDALPKKRRALFHVEHSQTDPDAGIIIGLGRIEAKP